MVIISASVFFSGCEKIEKIDKLSAQVEEQQRIINEQQRYIEEKESHAQSVWTLLGGVVLVIVAIKGIFVLAKLLRRG